MKLFNFFKRKQKSIYVVSCIRIKLNDGQVVYDEGTSTRAVGWLSDIETAVNCVKDNVLDICENDYYHFAVIEKVPEGFYPIETKEIAWFEFDLKTDKYKLCEKPKWSVGTICWGLG